MPGLTPELKYAGVAGAVTGGGLTGPGGAAEQGARAIGRITRLAAEALSPGSVVAEEDD